MGVPLRAGPDESSPRHSHAEYQLALSFGFPGEYGAAGPPRVPSAP